MLDWIYDRETDLFVRPIWWLCCQWSQKWGDYHQTTSTDHRHLQDGFYNIFSECKLSNTPSAKCNKQNRYYTFTSLQQNNLRWLVVSQRFISQCQTNRRHLTRLQFSRFVSLSSAKMLLDGCTVVFCLHKIITPSAKQRKSDSGLWNRAFNVHTSGTLHLHCP